MSRHDHSIKKQDLSEGVGEMQQQDFVASQIYQGIWDAEEEDDFMAA